MRKIQLDDGVFNKIVGTERKISSYWHFCNIQKSINTDVKSLVMTDFYRSLIIKNQDLFEDLAKLEDLITLYRIRLNRDFNLYLQRGYVYARQACPREDTCNRDIRLIITKVSNFPEGTDVLTDEAIMKMADEAICEYLDKMIKEKENEIQHLINQAYEKEEHAVSL